MKYHLLTFLLFYSIACMAQSPDWVYLSKSVNVSSFAEEGNYIWIGNQSGLVKMEKTTGIKTHYDKSNCPIPDNWVIDIVIDNGIKWIATSNTGIARFDGVNWIVYDTSNAPFPGTHLQSIAVDSSHNLWVRTSYINGGLFKFDGTTWTVYNTSNSGLPSNSLSALYADGNTIWVGIGAGQGLTRFDGTTWTTYTTSNSSISNANILAIEKDRNGKLWLLHYNGVESFNGSTFQFFNQTNTNIQNINNYSMTIDTNNIIWTGCTTYNYSPVVQGGIMSFNGTSWTKYDINNSPISNTEVGTIFTDRSNNIWLGGDESGLVDCKSAALWSVYDPSKTQLINSRVRQITCDANGRAFIGTIASDTSSGLVTYDWFSWTRMPYYNYNWSTYCMASDKQGNIFFKDPSGIKKYNGTNWASIPVNPPLLYSPYPVGIDLSAMDFDTSGGIWIDFLDHVSIVFDTINGSNTYHPYEALAHYDGVTWTYYSSSNSSLSGQYILDIKVDHSNNVWISTSAGLTKFDGSVWTTFNTSNSCLPSNYIRYITTDTVNNVWFSDNHFGLIRFDGTTCINYPHPTLSSFSGSGALKTDMDGTIWQINLLRVIHFDGLNWTTFSSQNSPIPDFCNTNSLAIDKFGNKWIGTNNGVLVYRQGGVIVDVPFISNKEASVRVYPNPFREKFEIKLDRRYPNIQATLYDQLSRIVFVSGLDDADVIKVQRKNLPAGVYFYQLKSENEIINSGKVVVY